MIGSSLDRSVLERVIAFINGKGGVGKTTLTANVGGLMARNGQRVLIVDIDPQGNLGLDLGIADTDVDDSGRSLSASLQGLTDQVNIVKDVRPGLDVIVGGAALHGASAALASPGRGVEPRDALAAVLSTVADDYDLILVDCPPGNESLQTTAIAASRWVVAPARVDEGTGRGLGELADRLESVVAVNPSLDLLGVVLFDLDKNATLIEAESRQMITEALGSDQKLFKASIRHATSVAQQARKYGKLVHELDAYAKAQPEWWQQLRDGKPATERVTRSAGNVAEDLLAFTAEMMQRLVDHEEGAK